MRAWPEDRPCVPTVAETREHSATSQANFIKTIGAVLPNARIDFQTVDAGTPTKPLTGGAVSLGSSAVPALQILMPQSPHVEPEVEPCGTRTPATGTPEWTPRGACEEQASQVLSSLSGSERSHIYSDLSPLTRQVSSPGCTQQGQQVWGGCAQPLVEPVVQTREPIACPGIQPQMWSDASGAPHSSAHQLVHPEAWVDPTSAAPDRAAVQGASQIAWASPTSYADANATSWYRVAYLGGIELRMQPSVLGPRSGVLLSQNEVFAVSAEIVGADGRIYLRLADGRGWAFDDSALMPHDPSVVRGHFARMQSELPVQTGPSIPLEAASPQTSWQAAPESISWSISSTAATSQYAYHTAGSSVPPEEVPVQTSGGMTTTYMYSGAPVQSLDQVQSAHTHIAIFPSHQVAGPTCVGSFVSHAPTQAFQGEAVFSWDQTVSSCQGTWQSEVTKDCPPLWTPLVGSAVEPSYGPTQWTQHM
jgi:hypothetical protein